MTYNVRLTQNAKLDLNDIFVYLCELTKDPQIALKFNRDLKNCISELAEMPRIHPIINCDPFAFVGLRIKHIGNYNIFYRIIESEKSIHIIRILHQRREWKTILKNEII